MSFLANLLKVVLTGVPEFAPSDPLIRTEEPTSSVGLAKEAPLPDPLAAARARGRRFAMEEYDHPDNLPLLDARTYSGCNERSINEARQRGELYALVQSGKTRGFRYPKWQFDADRARLAVVLKPFVDAQANCWVVHAFMLRANEELNGSSPAQVILDPRMDIAPVVALAQRQLVDEQGAL